MVKVVLLIIAKQTKLGIWLLLKNVFCYHVQNHPQILQLVDGGGMICKTPDINAQMGLSLKLEPTHGGIQIALWQNYGIPQKQLNVYVSVCVFSGHP